MNLAGYRFFVFVNSLGTLTISWLRSKTSVSLQYVILPLALLIVFQSVLLSAEEIFPLDVRQVRIGGEMGRRLDATIYNNLMAIDVDKHYLAYLDTQVGFERYVGLGKLIDFAVKSAAYTGDEKVLARKKYILDKVLAAQEANGYIGFLAPAHRVKGFWDLHEMGYLIYGLTADYHYFHEKSSLDAARKLADYLLAHWEDLPADWPRQASVARDVALTGLDGNLLSLAEESRDMRYRDFCVRQRALPEWKMDPVVGRRPLVEGHSYAHLSRCLAQLALYRLNGKKDEALLLQSRKVWDFMTQGEGMTITGACGQWECWTNDQDGRGALAETCSTAYQLRLLDELQRFGAHTSHFGDVAERIIYNTLFAAQSPDGRQLRYYTPFEGPREYFPRDNYCCPGNFRRIMADLPSMVYYRTARAVIVNLYTPSTAKDISIDHEESATTATKFNATSPRNGKNVLVTLRQETNYPNSGKVTIFVEPAKEVAFALHLRIPRWCPLAKVSVNGTAEQGPFEPGSYACLDRKWKPGDRVDLELEMPWRFVLGRQRQAGRVAVMRGPVLFGINPLRKENAPYKDWDGADLGKLVIVTESIQGPLLDEALRPGGQTCRIKAFQSGYGCDQPETELVLSEFPDPDCRAVYFRLRDLSQGVKDELFAPPSSSPPIAN